MFEAHDADAPRHAHDGARYLLMRLYRDIGISAVAAALEVSRLPDPSDAPKSHETNDVPSILRGHDLAA